MSSCSASQAPRVRTAERRSDPRFPRNSGGAAFTPSRPLNGQCRYSAALQMGEWDGWVSFQQHGKSDKCHGQETAFAF